MAAKEDLVNVVTAQHAGVRADLEELVRLPSIAFDGFDLTQVDRSAELVARLFREAGVENARPERVGDGRPAVIGRRAAPPGAPTVLLYAHHDVQPVGDLSQWDSEPFEPVERNGRLYGRGAADDKAGVMAHVAALRAFGGSPPVGISLFIEGEEEYSTASLRPLLEKHREELAPDVIVVADSANWAVGQPALTTSLRGGVSVLVQVRTAKHAVHSGIFGGVAPDALTALCRLLATLHDDAGDPAVAGLVRGDAAKLDYPEERFRAEAGLLDSVHLIGTGSIPERLWARPAITVVGIDAPPIASAPNALSPVATAKVSLRLAPGENAERAFGLLRDHLMTHAPWGAEVTVTKRFSGQPWSVSGDIRILDAARAAFATAWQGTAPVDMGMGGSIPVVDIFAELYPDATILVTGVEDPDSRAHGANESLHLGDFAKVCLAEALLLSNVAEVAR
ncbi:dipeptidase [Rhizocola hellebori]|uniref:Dipeptidase n=1 Tax=Rhizocola hellebori TaxID=1392758 RepID=A0A8J3QL67_9ACTN|nr:dipeptidase [Rhizocola hellebori]GIH11632.1 dipeptidase [Rhizocola hellebori]